MALMMGVSSVVGIGSVSAQSLTTSTTTTAVTTKTSEDYAQLFYNMMELIMNNTIDDSITRETLFLEAMKGMFKKLDPYSEFFTKTEAQNFTTSVSKQYIGIGVELSQKGDYVVITNVFLGGPAKAAGVEAGDEILAVDGVSAKGMNIQTLISKVMGEVGTSVDILFQRGKVQFKKTIIRQVITVKSVDTMTLPKSYLLTPEQTSQISYLRLSSFSSNTDVEFNDAITAAKDAGAKYLILDLRDNGGGYVQTAINICKSIIPAGTIMHFENKTGEQVVFSSALTEPPFYIVALINEYSASATEFVSAAIQDSKVGVLVGETTYGKGVAQYLYDIEDTYMVKLTTEEFFSRDGKVIQQKGVSPDFPVEIPNLISSDHRFFVGDQNPVIKNIEGILAYLGYFKGIPDETFGADTVLAMKTFQKASGLFPYNICDFTTQKTLNEKFAAEFTKKDTQLDKAVEIVLSKINEKK